MGSCLFCLRIISPLHPLFPMHVLGGSSIGSLHPDADARMPAKYGYQKSGELLAAQKWIQ